MLRRALLAVAVLSYLICVLVLSGGQREDIKGIPKQLAYNVNVKNLFNNVDLYRNCRNNSNVDISKTLLNSSSFDKVIKQLHELSNDRNSRKLKDKYKQTEATEPEKVVIARDKRTAVTNNFDDHTNFYLEPNGNQNVKYADSKPDFHNVISFWRRFGKRTHTPTTDNPKQIHQNNMLSNFLNKTNNDYFSKLIINKSLRDKDIIEGEYLGSVSPTLGHKHITTETSTAMTPSADIVTDDDTDIFKYILDSPDNESVEKHDLNAHVNQYSYEINYSKTVYKNNNKTKHTDDSLEKDKSDRINQYEYLKTKNSRHSFNFHEDKNVTSTTPKTVHRENFIHKHDPIIMKDNEHYKSDNSEHHIPIHEEMDVKYSIERTQYLYTTGKPDRYDKIFVDSNTTSTLPPDVLKKIAEDVKAMILKDLKSTTTTMLPVPIERGLDALVPRYNPEQNINPSYNPGQNVNPSYNPGQNVNPSYDPGQNVNPSYNPGQNVMPSFNGGHNMPKPYPLTKILDILQKYRNGENLSIYRKPNEPVTISTTTPKEVQNQNILYPYYLPIESKPLNFDNNSPYINPYGIYKPAHSKKISPRLKVVIKKPKSVAPKRDIPKQYHTSNNVKSTPITLQTNLIEIPPIGVPIAEPLAFLNHHLIISTRRPYRNKQRNPMKNDMKIKNPIIKHKPVRTRNIKPGINKNISYDYKKNNKKSQDKKRMSDVDESSEINTTKPRDVYRPRSQSNIKKFHEKLEQYPRKHKADCCKDEIFTSEQVGEEMRSRDELSFRNLLKTQQKVTDMLTMMLAKRKNEDLPLSVEAA